MADGEKHSWGKYFGGFFEGRNYLKASVFLFCSIVIISIIGALTFTALTLRGCQRQQSDTKIGTNSGTLTQNTTTASTSVVNHYYPLSDLFNWFGIRKIEKDK